jgi:outer membrane protein insertion porin family
LLLPSALQAAIDEPAFQPYEGRPIVSIRFTGNRSTRDFVIEREIGLAVGDVLSTAELTKGLQNLENLDVFGSIDVRLEETPDGVALDYRFREMPTIIPFLSFRYTEENGFSIGPAVTSVNLFGRGISASGRVLFGSTSTLELRLKYPWFAGDHHLGLDLTANHLVRDDELVGFEEKSDEITPWINRYIGENGRVRALAGYFRMRADRDGVTLSPDRSDQFFRVGAAVGVDTRDSWRAPRGGWQNEIELVGSFGDGDFATLTVDLRRFQRIDKVRTLFIGALTSFQAGTVGEDVPDYFQYRMGGANSVRGQSVDLGKTLYGKNQLITTLEYQMNIIPLRSYDFFKWSAAMGVQLAFFTDTGVAWSSADEFSSDRAKTGVGVGLRLLVPAVEMVRFDVGINANGEAHFHFETGSKWTEQRDRLR